ncbi:MAG: hypothetical protein ACOC22_02210 [bacterium]
MEQTDAKPLHEVVQFAVESAYLQKNNVDVAYPYIAGPPGGGKTASIVNLCQQFNWGFLSTHFALKPLEEVGGIPNFEKINLQGKEMLGTVWSYPDIFGKLYEISNDHEMVVWLLDDMHLCGAVHMAMMYELLTERTLRGYKLPENVAIVLAGNHASNKAGAKTMFSAIINRMTLMPVYTDFDHWKKKFALPNNVHSGVISFLENTQYQQFFHEEETVDTPWCSPRSWTRLSNYMINKENWKKKPMSTNELLYIASGHVGKTAASEFTQYYNIFSKFDIEQIFEGIDNFELSDNSVENYALAYAATSHMAGLEKNERKRKIPQFSKLVYKFVQEREDLGLMIIHEIINLENVLGYRNFYFDVASQLNSIDAETTRKLITRINSDVE